MSSSTVDPGGAAHSGEGNSRQRDGAQGGNGYEPHFHSTSLEFVEQLYQQFLSDPGSVPQDWRAYFQSQGEPDPGTLTGPAFPRRSLFNPASLGDGGLRRPQRLEVAGRQERLDQLVRNYRVRGHILAELDPLGQTRGTPAELSPDFYGFSEADLDRRFSTAWLGGPEVRTLREIIDWLKLTYCRSIGAQFMHIDSLRVREWLQTRMETTGNRLTLSRDEQVRILHRLSDAVLFEEFVQKRFLGQKSFSLSGAETLIPLLDLTIEQAATDGIRQIIFGMAHRGRLNVLANVLGKSPRRIFREFHDMDPDLNMGRGDVKYHLGYSSDWVSSEGQKVHLSLCFNPSHLEFINTVAQGRLRARLDRDRDPEHKTGLVVLIHGDAAFAGEGIIQETLNLSELPGYETGGTIHVIVNNQIGFTTSSQEARSCTYATDVARMLQIPIFHVNGEDPEAVAQVVRLAMDFRRTFRRDVVIDMYCYRRYGHNESDEPEFTQPLMYKQIRNRKSIFEGYLDRLLKLEGVTREEVDAIMEQRRAVLEDHFAHAKDEDLPRDSGPTGPVWVDYHGGDVQQAEAVDSTVPRAELERVGQALCTLPEWFKPHPKIEKLLEARREMVQGDRPLDWGMGELLAFGSLVKQGFPFRLSGQDVGRGTFSQRHVVLTDYDNGERYSTLKPLALDNGIVEIHNSPLSEAGVLGFEYGYSLDSPEGLVIWEAQFGDFCNAAQVIIDQFIASAEDKWRRFSGIVLLLPHGFEGQGPEHSSARLERFLALAAEDNMQICVPSTPAQHFHMLRRQVLRRWKKPLVVMTPKSLLRHPKAVSTLADLAAGPFQEVIPDRAVDPRQVTRVLLCSGKIYYELVAKREELQRSDVAIVRVEQLYPFPGDSLRGMLAEFGEPVELRWVQEEPENMGAGRFIRLTASEVLAGRPLKAISRPASASPATGSARSHQREQELVLNAAFAK